MTLTHSLRPVLVLIATVLFLALFHSGAVALTCNDTAGGSSFRLVAVHETALEEQSATREEMDRIASQVDVPAAVRAIHPLMLILAQAGVHVETTHRTIKVRGPAQEMYFCDVPTSIVVRLGVFKHHLILYRDAAQDTCVRAVLLDHYREHSHVLDETIDRFIDEHRVKFADALHDLTQQTAPDPASATEKLEAGLASTIGALYRKFELQVEQSRLVADTPAALGELRKACDGKLHRLEQELGASGDRHASL
jgi:hypothetical protein